MSAADPSSGNAEDKSHAKKNRSRIHLVVLALAAVLPWANGTTGDFVWIDHIEIEQAGYRVQSRLDFITLWFTSLDRYLERNEGTLVATGGYFRPVYALSLSTDWELWNGRPIYYHFENLAWHLAVVLGLYFLGQKLLVKRKHAESLAFWSALLFAVHPLGVHSITWISGRKDLMCAAFSLGALLSLAHVMHHDQLGSDRRIAKPWLWIVVGSGCLLAAILSKESAFVVPLFAGIWYALWWRLKLWSTAFPRVPSWMALALLWGTAILAWAYRILVLGRPGLDALYLGDSLVTNAGSFARLWWYYVARVFWPFDPTIVDRWPISQEPGFLDVMALVGWLVVALLLLKGFVSRRSTVLLVLWFVIWLLPVSGPVPLRHMYAERYLYPASWGLLAFAVVLIHHYLPSRLSKVRLACLLLVTGLLAFSTIRANRHWQTDETLFTHAIEQDPAYAEGRIGLALLALERKDYDQVIQHSQAALETVADRTHASYGSPFVLQTNWGLALYYLDRHEEAAGHFEEAHGVRPKNAISHYNLGLNAFALGKFPESEQHYRATLRLYPEHYLAQSNLAYLLFLEGNLKASIRMLVKLVDREPLDLLNRANLATAYLIDAQFDQAEIQFEAILDQQTEDEAVFLAKLAWAEWKQDKADEARLHLESARRVRRDHPTVQHVGRMMAQKRE